jgi:hypothetical protein
MKQQAKRAGKALQTNMDKAILRSYKTGFSPGGFRKTTQADGQKYRQNR